MNPVHFKSERLDWGTPQELFDKLNEEFHFTLDVCALPGNAKCRKYFSPHEDGLSQKWSGVCWMNPPYGREIEKWMQKACRESERGATVVCLVPAHTDTEWWHKYALQGEIRFLRGRVRFQGANATAPFPSAIVIFRDQWWKRRWLDRQPPGSKQRVLRIRDGRRLLAAWPRQGVLGDQQDECNARSFEWWCAP